MFWTCFGVIISKNFFAQCSLVGRVFENSQKNQKLFKIAKMPKIFPKSVQTWFEHVLGYIFRNFFLPSLRKFSKESKIFQNCRKVCPNVFWTCFGVIFSKVFLPSVLWRVESSKIFKKKKIENFSKLQKSLKSFPKMSKRVLNIFWGNFFESFFAQCSMEGRVFENFQTN